MAFFLKLLILNMLMLQYYQNQIKKIEDKTKAKKNNIH